MRDINNKTSLDNQYKKLLKHCDGNLNKLIKDDGIVISQSDNKIFRNFLEMLIVSYRAGNKTFIEEHKNNENENVFWDFMEKFVNQNNVPYNETSALRALELNDFISCAEELYEKYIVYNDDIKKNKWLKEKDVFSFVKLLNLCIDIVIVKRFSINDFKHSVDMTFGLDNKKITFLWDLIQKDKQELRVNFIISKLDEFDSYYEKNGN